MGCSKLLSAAGIGHHYDAADEIETFAELITTLQTAVMRDEVDCITSTLELLQTKCPTITDGLPRDAGRLRSLPPDDLGLILPVIWVLVRAEVIRFATQRARRYRLPQSEREEVIDRTEEKLIECFLGPTPPTFKNYDRFAAYINTATTNTAITAYVKLARRPSVGTLTGKDDMGMRPVSGKWPKPGTRTRGRSTGPVDPDPPTFM
jgi:hypothetical protein